MPNTLTIAKIPRNRLVVGLTFVLSMAIGFAVIGSTNQYFARRHLRNEAQLIMRGFELTLRQAKQELSQLPPVDQLDCTGGTSRFLSRRMFENGAVRWLGIVKDGKVACRSHLVGFSPADPTDHPSRAHQIDAHWSLRSLLDPNLHLALFLVHERFGMRYVAAIEPPRIAYIATSACVDCQAMHLRIMSRPPIEMSSPALERMPALRQEVRSDTAGLPISLILEADDSYLKQYHLQGWLASLALVLTISILLTLLVLHLLRVRDSLDFMIREGLRQHAFVPYYQPIIDSRDGTVLGAEALVRWVKADGAMLPPDQFIPYAEESGLILPITDQLTELVVEDTKHFGWAGTSCYVSINLVPEQLRDDSYCERLGLLISETGIEPRNVAVEITERRQFSDLTCGRKVLGKLVERGVEVKLDDAGTGFGGFSYVQELPIGTLKIDKMFVDTLRSGRDAKRQVLDAIVSFAQTSGLQTIAEGVETPEQVAQLSAMGVFAIQGYVYAKPMKRDDFIRWMAAR